ncbi:hypothetical protein Acid345_3397 [Candidatus Koribacter versatilis Ellin345]|uniref:Uncharacterized protein n=1 Tax=Koribacter versatilis (strain Ellin345) TaxID=204669 RepID=Q1IL52_KORVE|nr:hypothetical protein Acid345_3397 [Candidatus Koribacter versatilis Ellin345]
MRRGPLQDLLRRTKRFKRGRIRNRRVSLQRRLRRRKNLVPQLRVVIPPSFSILDDPESNLAFISRFRSQLSAKMYRSVHFDHSGCKNLGMDAQAIVDVLVAEELARRPNGIGIGGDFPRDARTNVMLRAIGTLRQFGHPEMKLAPEVESRIERCDRVNGNGHNLKYSSERDRAALALVTYVERVLQHQSFMLTFEGRSDLSSIITEVIGNAEEHSGRWYAVAFSQPGIVEQQGMPEPEECQMVLFNFGRSIYESLVSRGASTYVKERISALANEHRHSRQFSDSWTEEDLWTLAALQQGVSRYRTDEKGKTRGNGTIELIRAFSELSDVPKKMCVVSGHTYILFDGSYKLRADSNGLQMIAFNTSNDLEKPPDPRYVRHLKHGFPGTIISMRFVMDSRYLESRIQSNGSSERN